MNLLPELNNPNKNKNHLEIDDKKLLNDNEALLGNIRK